MDVKNKVKMKKSNCFVFICELILLGMKGKYTDK